MTDLKQAEHDSAEATVKKKPWAKYAAVGTFMFFLIKGLGWIVLAVLGVMGVGELTTD